MKNSIFFKLENFLFKNRSMDEHRSDKDHVARGNDGRLVESVHVKTRNDSRAMSGDIASELCGPYGFTQLSRAVWDGNTEEVIRLIKEGADIDQLDDHGLNPLHRAIIQNDADIIRILLSAGASMDKRNKFGLTPLELALHYKSKKAISLLSETE